MRSPRAHFSLLVVTLVAGLACALVSPAEPAAAASPAEAVLAEVNRVRAGHGLRPLRRDGRLAQATQRHVGELMRRNVFEHGDLAGRLRRAGAAGPRFGENLAWGGGSLAARRVVELWLNSPPHRRNLLRPGWRRVGIGVADGPFSGLSRARVVGAAFAGA